jgi:hypothetical protein
MRGGFLDNPHLGTTLTTATAMKSVPNRPILIHGPINHADKPRLLPLLMEKPSEPTAPPAETPMVAGNYRINTTVSLGKI